MGPLHFLTFKASKATPENQAQHQAAASLQSHREALMNAYGLT